MIIKNTLNKNYPIIYVFIIIFLTIFSQYSYGNWTGADLIFHVIRLDAVTQAINDNVLFEYIDSNALFGYGYGTNLFYSDFFLIPFAFIGKYTTTSIAYTTLMFALHILCAYISFISIRQIGYNKHISYLFSILYTFSFYRLMNVYERDALGESLAMTFIPLLIWGFYDIVYNDYKKWYILSLGYTFIALSHALSILITGIAGFTFLIFSSKQLWREKIRFKYLLFATLSSFILSAYSLLPLIEQLYSNTFYVSSNKALFIGISTESFSSIIRGCFAGVSFVTNVTNFGIGIIITMALLSRLCLKKDKLIFKADRLVIITFPLFFIMSPLFLWHTPPFDKLNIIQFTTRFYSIIVPILCLAATIYLHKNFTKSSHTFIGTLIITLLIIIQITNSSNLNKIQVPFDLDLNVFSDNRDSIDHLGIAGAEYLPLKIPNRSFFKERGSDSIRIIRGENNIIGFHRINRSIYVTTANNNQTTIELPLTYYKGYKAYLNKEELTVNQSDYGLVELDINKEGIIQVAYKGTFITTISPYITFIGLFLLIIYSLHSYYKRNQFVRKRILIKQNN